MGCAGDAGVVAGFVVSRADLGFPWSAQSRPGRSLPCPYSRPTNVSKVTSGGHANRTGVYRFAPHPADTCM